MKSVAFLISASGGVVIVIFAIAGMKTLPGEALGLSFEPTDSLKLLPGCHCGVQRN